MIRAQKQHAERQTRKVLLIFHSLVVRDENFKALFFYRTQQRPVPRTLPVQTIDARNLVSREVALKRFRHTLVEDDFQGCNECSWNS